MTVNSPSVKRCQNCDQSVSPGEDEPIRPPDPLDLIGPTERVTVGETPGTSQHAIIAERTLEALTRRPLFGLLHRAPRTMPGAGSVPVF